MPRLNLTFVFITRVFGHLTLRESTRTQHNLLPFLSNVKLFLLKKMHLRIRKLRYFYFVDFAYNPRFVIKTVTLQ